MESRKARMKKIYVKTKRFQLQLKKSWPSLPAEKIIKKAGKFPCQLYDYLTGYYA
jgi:hypothetical protein